jgi:predicted RNA-binding protein YlxR (DUF448 family)
MSEPVRTCVGCGRRAAQSSLVRFAAVDGCVQAGRRLPGRGAYVCPSRVCFAQARRRRAFARSLRSPATVPAELESHFTDADYTGALHG